MISLQERILDPYYDFSCQASNGEFIPGVDFNVDQDIWGSVEAPINDLVVTIVNLIQVELEHKYGIF